MDAAITTALERAITTSPTKKKQSAVHAALDAHRELIARALSAGHSRTALARILVDAGVGASIATVRAYIASSIALKTTKKKIKRAK